MSKTLTLLLTLTLASVALAGCTDPNKDDENETTPTPEPSPEPTPTPTATPTATPSVSPTPTPPTPPLDSSTYKLAVAGAPGQAKPAQKFNFTLFVNGSVTHPTDHAGAHFANNDTATPDAAQMRGCEHSAGTLPGTFLVNCTIPDQGTWFVWGHARVNDSGELRNWWAPSPFPVKIRDYNITVANAPTAPVTSGSNFTIQLQVAGADNVTTDHLGAHYWNLTKADPTFESIDGSCEHLATGAVGKYDIKCAITNSGLAPKDYYLRGHLRITEGGTTLDWWSPEVKVNVGPAVGLPI